jgi:hypothetical protein
MLADLEENIFQKMVDIKRAEWADHNLCEMGKQSVFNVRSLFMPNPWAGSAPLLGDRPSEEFV